MSSVELSTTLHPTTGFHTTLSSRLQVNQTGHPPECSLYILHTFSPHLIVDPYELIDRHLPFEFFGASNLELPAWAVDQNSTYLLLKLAASVHTLSLMSEVSFDVPLHVRYGTPILGGSSHVVEVTAPTCFWACPSTFDTLSQTLTDIPSAVYSSVQPSSRLSAVGLTGILAPTNIAIPLGRLEDLSMVEDGTGTVITLAFLWILFQSYVVAHRLEGRHHKQE